MRLRLSRTRPARREPDLTSLINIVFLILIFFLVAGALRPFSARDVELAKVENRAADAVSPSTLVVHQDGRIVYRGEVVNLDDLEARLAAEADGKPMTVVADGRLPGRRLLEVVAALEAAGAASVAVMVERGRR